jgi:hypothetical protein
LAIAISIVIIDILIWLVFFYTIYYIWNSYKKILNLKMQANEWRMVALCITGIVFTAVQVTSITKKIGWAELPSHDGENRWQIIMMYIQNGV